MRGVRETRDGQRCRLLWPLIWTHQKTPILSDRDPLGDEIGNFSSSYFCSPALEAPEEHENDCCDVSNAGTPRDTYPVAFVFDLEVS